MTIHLISFASILHKQVSLRSSHEAILSEIEKYYTVKFVDHQDMDKLSSDDFKIIFVATGGVERLVIQHFENLPRPAILLADGMQNSLAAALEISTWLRGRGMKSEILHGELPAIILRIHTLYNNFQAQRSLFGKRIGVIGSPSSWLVASNVDYLLAKRRWGIMYVYVHPVNRYRLEVTRVGGSGYGYKIYERERLIIVQPFLLAQSCHLTGTTVSIWWHWSANTMAQGKALSTDYLFSSSLGATT